MEEQRTVASFTTCPECIPAVDAPFWTIDYSRASGFAACFPKRGNLVDIRETNACNASRAELDIDNAATWTEYQISVLCTL